MHLLLKTQGAVQIQMTMFAFQLEADINPCSANIDGREYVLVH
jgi:hypothetical protein